MLEDFQRESKKNENIKSIEDMQNFMERYPEYRSRSHNVSKHVAIMGELGRLVEECQLMDVSAFEQVRARGEGGAACQRATPSNRASKRAGRAGAPTTNRRERQHRARSRRGETPQAPPPCHTR
jgi:hypothetical protein